MIENIAKRILEVLPRYGSTFWTLLAHPVAEVAPRSRDGKMVWDAVLFWSAVSGLGSSATMTYVNFCATGFGFCGRMSGEGIGLWNRVGLSYTASTVSHTAGPGC